MRRAPTILRATLAAALAVGLFCGSIFLGTPHEGRAAAKPTEPKRGLYADGEMPQFPNVLEFPLADGLELNGTPVRVSYFVTPRAAEDVRDFYQAEFARASKMPVDVKKIDQGYYLSVFVPASSMVRSVTIRREGAQTIAFPSVVPLGTAPTRMFPGEDPEVPYGPTSMASSDVLSNGEGAGRIVVFHDSERIGAVRARVDQWMKAHGWTAAGRGKKDAAAYTRPGKRASVFLKAFDNDAVGTSVVYEIDASKE
jgi:hypothetical protein